MERHDHAISPTHLRLALQEPLRLTESTPWQGHIPFAFVAVALVVPRRIVELGVARGDSYCALCQAVATLDLDAECAGIDTWLGDPHSGALDQSVLEALRAHHDPLYGRFSQLIQRTFDEALPLFADGSIDLLHIDGYHTYEAVQHDFDVWFPKLSNRAVVLLHDTASRQADFGVWRLWEELRHRFPSYAFEHASGLGILAVGPDVAQDFCRLLERLSTDGTTAALFAALGERLVERSRNSVLARAVDELRAALAGTAAEIEAAHRELEASRELERAARDATDNALQRADREHAERERVELRLHRLELDFQSEHEARVRADSDLAAVLATRTFRYSAGARGAYAKLRALHAPDSSSSGVSAPPPRIPEPSPPSSPQPWPEFVPPGHFYSAVPSLDELDQRRSELSNADPLAVPGVNLEVEKQLRLLDALLPLLQDVPFTQRPTANLRYYFANGMFDQSDGLFLHLMLRYLHPGQVVEIGSGYSSACTLDTVDQFLPGTHCTFLDPNPSILRSLLRAGDENRVEIMECMAQNAPSSLYASLRRGDLLFIDSTHVVKAGSDVNHLFFSVLPELAPGVVVHIHDIFPAFEYPWEWLHEGRVWSEDYLLRAFLQFNSAFEIVLWPPLLARVAPAEYARFGQPTENAGGSIYLRRVCKASARRERPAQWTL